MTVSVTTSEFAYNRTDAGVMRIGSTRVSLDSVIIAFNQGHSPEEIALDFDSLTLGDVYSAINYYLQNRNEVEQYLAERAEQNEHLRLEIEARFDPQIIRERLLSRNGS
ncbi:MAG: DUF433 domain-containing protein [Acidobacteria bacterium]|nr:DUF433 domain-containing protein [Acidobacteriota bacterium]